MKLAKNKTESEMLPSKADNKMYVKTIKRNMC